MGTLGGVITKEKVWRGCLSPHTVLMKPRTMHGSMCGTFLILGDVCVDLAVIFPGAAAIVRVGGAATID